MWINIVRLLGVQIVKVNMVNHLCSRINIYVISGGVDKTARPSTMLKTFTCRQEINGFHRVYLRTI